jgi:hypothetical protein
MVDLPTQYAIFGSGDSTDMDVMYFIDEFPSLQGCKSLAIELESNFDQELNPDVNICTVKRNRITNVYKGTVDEANNMLFYTITNHSQPSSYPSITPVKRDVPLKTARALRGILSAISRTQYRVAVKAALKGDAKAKVDTLRGIDLSTITKMGDKNNMSLRDFYKLFAFQVGQTSGLFVNNELYTKSDIASEYPVLMPHLYKELDVFPQIEQIKNQFLDQVLLHTNLDDVHE